LSNTPEQTTPASSSKLLYGLNDRPPLPQAILAAFQHFLAIFVSIMTAPLIISLGMGLSAKETSFVISSSLMVSGFATLIQVIRIGPMGAKLLCIQGTSFSFIGPMIFAASSLKGTMSPEEILGVMFGTAAVGAMCVMALSFYLEKLKTIVTPVVTGTAVLLLGISLVLVTIGNLIREYDQIVEQGAPTLSFWLMSVGVILIILFFTNSKNPWLKLSSISIGIGAGYIYALFMGMVDFAPMSELPAVFVPQVLSYPIGFDMGVFIALFPIYLVTLTESIGDITATSSLSNEKISGPIYWERVRKGVLADGFNSVLASVFNTYPNTTFSQNNGVIQLTGVASRYVGVFVAFLLIIVAIFPFFGGLFQIMPKPLLYGATGLMFALISVSGYRIIKLGSDTPRSWSIVIISMVTALAMNFIAGYFDDLHPQLKLFFSFPVALGTIVAIVLEKVYPQPKPVAATE